MMKKKKTDFEAKFWSGTRKHSELGLLETFFQFNDLAVTKEILSQMVQCSVQENIRTTKEPAEVFHLYQSLRSLIRVSHLIAKKGKFKNSSEANFSKIVMSLSEKEYRNPLLVFRSVFKVCTLQEFDEFLSAMVYFSLGNSRCETEKKIMIPYIQLMKILDAAWLIVERVSKEK